MGFLNQWKCNFEYQFMWLEMLSSPQLLEDCAQAGIDVSLRCSWSSFVVPLCIVGGYVN